MGCCQGLSLCWKACYGKERLHASGPDHSFTQRPSRAGTQENSENHQVDEVRADRDKTVGRWGFMAGPCRKHDLAPHHCNQQDCQNPKCQQGIWVDTAHDWHRCSRPGGSEAGLCASNPSVDLGALSWPLNPQICSREEKRRQKAKWGKLLGKSDYSWN